MSKRFKRNRPPQKDLVAHWFDKYSPDIENGIISSPIGDDSRLPQAGRAYNFDGVDDLLNTNTDINIRSNGGFIAYYNIYREIGNDNLFLYSNRSTFSGFYFRIWNTGSGDFFRVNNFVDDVFNDSSIFLDGELCPYNEWVSLILIYDDVNSNVVLKVNGVTKVNYTITSPSNYGGGNLFLMRDNDANVGSSSKLSNFAISSIYSLQIIQEFENINKYYN